MLVFILITLQRCNAQCQSSRGMQTVRGLKCHSFRYFGAARLAGVQVDAIVLCLATANGGAVGGVCIGRLPHGIAKGDGMGVPTETAINLETTPLEQQGSKRGVFARNVAAETTRRSLEIFLAAIGLLVLWPVIAVAMVITRLDSPGPAILKQTRVGRHRRAFTIYKLRTMRHGTRAAATHEVGAAALTRFGRLARRFKLDELPQLINVVRGDMSLVGPRPSLPSQTELVEARQILGVLTVRPGITGLAQVQRIDMSDPQRLAQIDAQYVRSRTLAGDFKLLLATLLGSGLGVDHVVKHN